MPDVLQPITDEISLHVRDNTILWLRIDVPPGTPTGLYTGSVRFAREGELEDVVPLSLRVHPTVGEGGATELDVWPGWSALEAHYDLQPFSDRWWQMIEKCLRTLAHTGADVVQVGRRYVRWRRAADGQYQFDFINFDRYVRLCGGLGIAGPIEYLAMVDTTGPTQVYFDTPDEGMVAREVEPGDELYDEAWSAFLRALGRHCDKQGWEDRLRFFVADRPSPEDIAGIRRAVTLVDTASQNLLTTATVDDPAVARELAEVIDRLVFPISNTEGPMQDTIRYLRDRGRIPACYVESGGDMLAAGSQTARRVPSLARERGFDGILIGNFARWPDDLQRTAEGFRTKHPFRCLVYPGKDGPLSSLRLERLRLMLQPGGSLPGPEPTDTSAGG